MIGEDTVFLLEAPPSRLIAGRRATAWTMWNYRIEAHEPLLIPRSAYDLHYRDYIPQTQECLDIFDSLLSEGYGTIDAMFATLEIQQYEFSNEAHDDDLADS